ncbi:MAG: hypothetical protein AAFW89_11565 [Bacteroidota bacterium]
MKKLVFKPYQKRVTMSHTVPLFTPFIRLTKQKDEAGYVIHVVFAHKQGQEIIVRTTKEKTKNHHDPALVMHIHCEGLNSDGIVYTYHKHPFKWNDPMSGKVIVRIHNGETDPNEVETEMDLAEAEIDDMTPPSA